MFIAFFFLQIIFEIVGNFLTDEIDDDADALPQALEQWVESSKQLISAETLEAILHSALHDIASRTHKLMLHHQYTRVSTEVQFFSKSLVLTALRNYTVNYFIDRCRS